MEQELHIIDREGIRADRFAEAVVLTWHPLLSSTCFSGSAQKVETALDLNEQAALKVSGRYWKVGMLAGSPIYRQEAPCFDKQVNGEQLYLTRHDWIDQQKNNKQNKKHNKKQKKKLLL